MKLRAIGDQSRNEAVCREFISPVLIAAALLVPGTQIDAERIITDDEGTGYERQRVDNSIFKGGENYYVSAWSKRVR